MSRPAEIRAIRDASALTVGTVVGGFASYAFVSIGTRTIGSAGFAPISMLWSFWAISAAAVTFPITHWVIRTVEASGEPYVRSALPRVAAVAVTLSVAFGVLTYLGRELIFFEDTAVYPLVAGGIPIGSSLVGLSRGHLAAHHRYGAAASSIAGENLLRVLAGGLAAWLGAGPHTFAWALLAGFVIVLVHPSALRFQRDSILKVQTASLAFLSGVAGGSIIAQGILTGGPVALALLGGTPTQITGLFSALAIFRAPYLISAGVSARLTGTLTRIHVQGERGTLMGLWRRSLGTSAAAIPAAAVFGLVLGPPILRLVFGPEVSLASELCALIAAASTAALTALLGTLVLVATDRGPAVTQTWLCAAVGFTGWALIGVGSPLTRVVWAFLIAELLAVIAMSVFIFYGPRLPGAR